MSAEPTNAEKMRRLPWAIANVSLNAIFAQITFGGPIFLLYLAELGLPKSGIGFLLSLFPFCGLLALVVGPAVARVGFKRAFITFYGARKIVLAALLLTPWVVATHGPQGAFIFVSVVILAFAILRAIAETAYNPWFQEFVPNAIRGRFSGVSNIAISLAGALALAAASAVVSASAGLSRFMLLLVVGVAFGLASVACAFFIPGGAPVHSAAGSLPSARVRNILDTLQNRDFVLYLCGIALITLGAAPLVFVPLLLTEQVGLAQGTVVLLSSVTMLGVLASSYLWGWAADRWGSRPVMLLGLSASSVIPLAWLLVPHNAMLSSPVAIAVAFLAGLSSAGWSVGSLRLLFNNIVPPEKKMEYLSIHYAWAGLMGGLGPLLAGVILDLFRVTGPRAFGIALDPYTPLFLLSFIMSAVSVWIFRQLRDYSAITTRELAGMLFRGNPVRAARTLIEYRRARAEIERVSVTERMGAAKSLLNADELLDALSDPSFNVRHEAIVAIARMRPDDRLLNALVDVLNCNEPDLSINAVWALGRLGDKRAIEPLREALGSRYALIQAHSARALATLGDYDIIPVLLDRFKSEPDDGLRIAYASALGALRSKDAVDGLLAFLYTTRGTHPRMELALALARIASQAEHFVILARQARIEPSTALSQAALALRRLKLTTSINQHFGPKCEECADAFARNELGRGASLLAAIAHELPLDDLNSVHAALLCECVRRLNEFGAARIEYTLLTLHTVRAALNG
jgi:hypothetical protein